MSIQKRVSKALEQVANEGNKAQNKKCLKFVKDMERIGAIKRDQQTTVLPGAGGLEQLKLYSINFPIKYLNNLNSIL